MNGLTRKANLALRPKGSVRVSYVDILGKNILRKDNNKYKSPMGLFGMFKETYAAMVKGLRRMQGHEVTS